MNAFACSLALSAGIAFSAPAPATQRIETIMQDDAALLYRSPREVRRSLKRMADLGVTRVRITASWRHLAPHREWRQRPFFDATDSRRYDRRTLGRLDRAVKGARAEGMQVMLDLGFFAPRWAVQRPGTADRNVWRPDPREFARFSHAMATRYDGRFRDPTRRGHHLPAVRLWTTWNEPNHRIFLRPQWQRVRGRWEPMSPHVYRRMHEAAYAQLKRVSPENRVLIGGLASFGDPGRGPSRGIAPLRFTRELACVDSRLEPLRRSECRNFKPLRADGFAHHPYSFGTPPAAWDPTADRVQIGELPKLRWLLDQLEERGRLAQPLPLYLTEYGYQSDPPDPAGVSPPLAARYFGQALELARHEPRLRSFPQFLLYDIEPIRRDGRVGGFQTGLYTHDGRPKRVIISGFRLPLAISSSVDAQGRASTTASGQVRPGSGVRIAEIQRRDERERWVTEGCPFATDRQGLYRRRVSSAGPGVYRIRWLRPTGRPQAGPPIAARGR